MAVLGRPQGMAQRTFVDAEGVFWEVESVYPPVDWPDPRFDRTPPPGEELLGVRVTPIVGWLTFTSSAGTRRRLVPVPRDWVTASDADLERYCAAATPLGPTKLD